MTKPSRIIHTALCTHREKMEVEARGYWAKYSAAKTTDDRAIFLDKFIWASRECHEAHDALNCGARNPCDVWDRDFLDQIDAVNKAKAEAAYERAEAIVEDMALSAFHANAYGDAA